MEVRATTPGSKIAVYLEIGEKRVFAVAVEWPGWARAGRSDRGALANLAAYGERYREVVAHSRSGFEPPKDAAAFHVKERLRGNATTDFGAPGAMAKADLDPPAADELERSVRILRACWRAFGAAVTAARGVELRKGPRGGGRDVDRMMAHVAEAELGYIGALGMRAAEPGGDALGALDQIHERAVEALAARARGELPDEGARGAKRWPAAFFIRRTAWHALDHAWEIQDRAAPELVPAPAASAGS